MVKKMRKNTDSYLDDDDDRVVADGEHVRVPLHLCDATQRAVFAAYAHQPGFVSVSSAAVRDARREARDARQVWIRKMCDAWRTPLRSDAAEPDAAEALLKRHLGSEPDEDDAACAEKIRERTRAEYLDQLQNAWRTNPQAATTI